VRRSHFLSMTLIAVFGFAPCALADETWTAGSDIEIVGDMTIDDVLTIEPGVTVRVFPGSSLIVSSTGSLFVDGTEIAPVLFTESLEAFGWNGIEFEPGAMGVVRHATVEKSVSYGIRVDAAAPTIEHVAFREIVGSPGEDAAGVLVVNPGAAPIIRYSDFEDITGGTGLPGTTPPDGANGENGNDGAASIPGQDGEHGEDGDPGETGGRGGAGVGIDVADGAHALASDNLIGNLRGADGGPGATGARGGRGGDGGDGGNGLFIGSRGGDGARGGLGGRGGVGGAGGDAIGLRVRGGAAAEPRGNLITTLRGGDGFIGGDGGRGGRGGNGGDAGCGTQGCNDPGNGGNGRRGGTGGHGGTGGSAVGIRVLAHAGGVTVRDNVVTHLAGGNGGPPAMNGGNGGFGGISGGGNAAGGDGGRGGHAGNGGTGGRAVAIEAIACSTQVTMSHMTCIDSVAGLGELTPGGTGIPGQGGNGDPSGQDGAEGQPGVPGVVGSANAGRAADGVFTFNVRNSILSPGPSATSLTGAAGATIDSTGNCYFEYEGLGEGMVTGGGGDILADPLFVDAAGGDYRLSASSPCIDAAHPIPNEFERDAESWKVAQSGWEAYAFDEFFPGLANNTGCLSGSPTALDQLAGGTITVIGLDEAGDPKCAIADRGNANRISDADLTGPAGTTLVMQFDPPVSSFYTYFGSLEIGERATMHLYRDGVLVESLTSAPSPHQNRSFGHGFQGYALIDEIVFEGENTSMVVGARSIYYQGEPQLGQVEIPGYGGPNGDLIDLDFGCLFGAGEHGTDFDGNPRVVDGNNDGAADADIGAFERGAEVACATDIDGDGTTGFNDLLAVLATWGPCPDCAEDVDDDGAVGFSDLLAVLASWGPC